MNELADRLNVDKSAMSRTVNDLVSSDTEDTGYLYEIEVVRAYWRVQWI